MPLDFRRHGSVDVRVVCGVLATLVGVLRDIDLAEDAAHKPSRSPPNAGHVMET
jgi:hypothetical protein